jgi:hypothetical protein
MVICYGNIKGITVDKAKDHAPLIVDADAPESLQIVFQGLQMVRGRECHTLDIFCGMKRLQFDQCTFDNVGWKATILACLPQNFGFFCLPRFDHT